VERRLNPADPFNRLEKSAGILYASGVPSNPEVTAA
jgi:hypothetical protein